MDVNVCLCIVIGLWLRREVMMHHHSHRETLDGDMDSLLMQEGKEYNVNIVENK
jgi:hypothetical protein